MYMNLPLEKKVEAMKNLVSNAVYGRKVGTRDGQQDVNARYFTRTAGPAESPSGRSDRGRGRLGTMAWSPTRAKGGLGALQGRTQNPFVSTRVGLTKPGAVPELCNVSDRRD